MTFSSHDHVVISVQHAPHWSLMSANIYTVVVVVVVGVVVAAAAAGAKVYTVSDST